MPIQNRIDAASYDMTHIPRPQPKSYFQEIFMVFGFLPGSLVAQNMEIDFASQFG